MVLTIGIIDTLLFDFSNETTMDQHKQCYQPVKGIHLLAPFTKLNTLCQVPPVELIIFSTLAQSNHDMFYQSLRIHGLGFAKVIFITEQSIQSEIEKHQIHLLISQQESLNTQTNKRGILSVVPNLNTSYGKLKILFNCPFLTHTHATLMPFLKILGYLQKSASVSCEVSIWVNDRQHLNQQIRELFYLADCQIDSVIYDWQCNEVDVLYFYKPHLSFLREDQLKYSSTGTPYEDKNFTF